MTLHAGAGPAVLLTTEGTYPYHPGGVSTWCHALTRHLTEVDFTVLAVTMHPYLTPQYPVFPNVREVITVPLWGTADPAEYGRHASFSEYLRRRWATTAQDVEQDFLPSYEKLLREIVDPVLTPRAVGLVLLRLHLQLRHLDYHRAHANRAVWASFDRTTRDAWRTAYPAEVPPSVADVRDAWRMFYRLLLPLAIEPPRVDVTHAAAAAFCGLPCIVAKLRWGTPFLLTEHGVYLREQYLNLERSTASHFGRWFLVRVLNTIVDMNYAFADQISPVCEHNTRWERWRHVPQDRIRVIHNGADPAKFSASAREPNARPTVVCLAAIAPLKGQIDLIDAAQIVRQHVAEVQFLFHGPPMDDEYVHRCEARIRELGLQDHVVLAGATAVPATVLRQADVVALPSISEAFPFAVIEAMFSERAIVATDVGGVREALDDAGRLVPARNPAAMAEEIVALLRSPQDRARLGTRARERALRSFTEQQFVDQYRDSYRRLAVAGAAAAAHAGTGSPLIATASQNAATA